MTARRIGSNETEIRGKWIMIERRVEADDNSRRIEELVAHHLRELGRDATGWERLFIDPDDGRYWELTYPESGVHGGGPPCLRNLLEADARPKYSHLKL